MSREIKFRARNANVPRCWVYGYFVIENGECSIINDDGKFSVIAGTECQYTGLKDKNKEIYEGDIVEFNHVAHGRVFGCIGYKDCEYVILSNNWHLNIADEDLEIEVIGNIYENPELLECKS